MTMSTRAAESWVPNAPVRVAAIGECMIELVDGANGVQRGFGGDTLNTLVYLARVAGPMVQRAAYVTALGDDPLSTAMVAEWGKEGIDPAFVYTLPGALPGVYFIHNDAAGERYFLYWRQNAAARRLFECVRAETLSESLAAFDVLIVSAITFAILAPPDRAQLMRVVEDFRKRGGSLVFGSNYRPRLWAEAGEARRLFTVMADTATLMFSSLDDQRALFGDDGLETASERFRGRACAEAVVTAGAAGCRVVAAGGQIDVPQPEMVTAVDTTGAGDAFAGAYVAARIGGADPVRAAACAHRVAACAVQAPGAIVARERIPTLDLARCPP